MAFSNVFVQLLNDKGYSQADISRITNIPSSLISNYVKGVKSPTITNSIAIATAFNVSLDYLCGRTDDTTLYYKKEPLAQATDDTEDFRLKNIIECYHEMNEDGQERLHEQATMYADNPRYKKHGRVSDENAG